jgi:hypothetical protein
MTLEEMTGVSRPSFVPQSAAELQRMIFNDIDSGKFSTDFEFIQAMGKILAAIGEESLDSSKVVGITGYKGTRLPRWDVKEGKREFHIKDTITNQSVPDPRVIMIGKLVYTVGNQSGDGQAYMYETYCEAGKIYHGLISSLNWAWNGIGTWQA